MQIYTRVRAVSFFSVHLLGLVGCSPPTAQTPVTNTLMSVTPPIGGLCAIEMRVPLPTGITEMHLTATLKAATDKWIVLYDAKKPEEGEMWIPREAILMLLTGKAALNYKGLKIKWNTP